MCVPHGGRCMNAMLNECDAPVLFVFQVHDVGDRLAAVQALLEGQGFAVRAEQQQEGPAGNWLVFARRTS